jgi:hypothetical protein
VIDGVCLELEVEFADFVMRVRWVECVECVCGCCVFVGVGEIEAISAIVYICDRVYLVGESFPYLNYTIENYLINFLVGSTTIGVEMDDRLAKSGKSEDEIIDLLEIIRLSIPNTFKDWLMDCVLHEISCHILNTILVQLIRLAIIVISTPHL